MRVALGIYDARSIVFKVFGDNIYTIQVPREIIFDYQESVKYVLIYIHVLRDIGLIHLADVQLPPEMCIDDDE